MESRSALTGVPVLPRKDLLSLDPPALLGGRCVSCSQLSFPRERFCAYCGAEGPELTPLATRGTIYSWTIVRFAPPGYSGEVPFGVGIVELDDGIRITSTLSAEPLESLRVGATAAFRILEVATDDGPVTSWTYEVDE
jgi:scaffold protein (connect acetoacetyl-CoA thiolase and HMG-CoA synthase)